jgi:hypothetical protein
MTASPSIAPALGGEETNSLMLATTGTTTATGAGVRLIPALASTITHAGGNLIITGEIVGTTTAAVVTTPTAVAPKEALIRPHLAQVHQSYKNLGVQELHAFSP